MKPKVQTWLNNLQNGVIKSSTDKILNALNNAYPQPLTIVDIKNNLQITHQTTTAIISQLMDEGVVVATGELQDGDNVYSLLQLETDPERIKQNKQDRFNEKFSYWLARGVNEFGHMLDPFTLQTLVVIKANIDEEI